MIRLMYYAVNIEGNTILSKHFEEELICIINTDNPYPMQYVIVDYDGATEAVTAIAGLYSNWLPGYTKKQLFNGINQEFGRAIKAGITIQTQTGIFIQSLHTILSTENTQQ